MGAYPRVVHANPDGLKDLLIGEAYGTLRIFYNVNTDDVPVFDLGTLLQVGESGFEEDIDVGSRAAPDIVDWNNDGRRDLAVGSSDGRIHIFINEGEDLDPVYYTVQYAQEDGSDLIVPTGRSSPCVRDIDGDGKKDILTGNTEGQLLLYRNSGTDEEPEFSGYTMVESEGEPIDFPYTARSRIFLCDWTGDGLSDVLIGCEDGKVHLYQGIEAFHADKCAVPWDGIRRE